MLTGSGFSSSRVLVFSFGGLILAGTGLLYLPISASGAQHTLVDSLFTATSAVCVTGLIVADTPADYSAFGQVVIMLLIQAGGLGYMTLSSVVAMALGQRLSLRERITLQESLNIESREGLTRFALMVLKVTLLFEMAGALLLMIRWMFDESPGRALYLAVFHSISAFNNAGFSLFSDSLTSYRGDLAVNLIITGLIIAGGIGFPVLSEIWRFKSRGRLSVHVKLVVVMTAGLLAVGTVAIFLLEWKNPRTLGGLGVGESLLASWFQSVTARTAGFNTIDFAGISSPTVMLVMTLMFIGASPGSTGGGVKTSTFGLTLIALWATVRGLREPAAFGRRFGHELVARAFFICLISFLAVNVAAVILLVAHETETIAALFEATSAFATVGLSLGHADTGLSLSAGFGTLGKLTIAVLMFAGRVGPLTLAVALAGATSAQRHRYAEGRVLIG